MEFVWDNWDHADWTNDSCTAYPALTCLAATFNPKLAFRYGNAIGQEARYRKKDIILGPGVNIYRTPLSGRNFEYMGEDPYLSSRMVVPYVKGMQQNGVAACLKHFALNNQEKNRDKVNVEVSDRALYEIYLPAFKAGVQEGGVWAIMGSYNKYRGQYCSHHERLVNQILKRDWGFDGVMLTDWGSAHDTDEAARNGLDLEMGTWTNGLTWGISSAYDNYYLAQPFLKKIESGELPESLLDEKVRRVLRLCFRTNMNRNRPYGCKLTPEHAAIARQVAEEGIVLLKNDNHFFPIEKGRYQKIAVIGENAVKQLCLGGGSSELKPQKEISPLEGMIEKYGREHIVFTLGYASGEPNYSNELPSGLDADSLVEEAVKVAREADVVLFFGGLNKNFHQDCEGDDRLSMDLPFGQNELSGFARRPGYGQCHQRRGVPLGQTALLDSRETRRQQRPLLRRGVVSGRKRHAILQGRYSGGIPLVRHEENQIALPLRLRSLLHHLHLRKSPHQQEELPPRREGETLVHPEKQRPTGRSRDRTSIHEPEEAQRAAPRQGAESLREGIPPTGRRAGGRTRNPGQLICLLRRGHRRLETRERQISVACGLVVASDTLDDNHRSKRLTHKQKP